MFGYFLRKHSDLFIFRFRGSESLFISWSEGNIVSWKEYRRYTLQTLANLTWLCTLHPNTTPWLGIKVLGHKHSPSKSLQVGPPSPDIVENSKSNVTVVPLQVKPWRWSFDVAVAIFFCLVLLAFFFFIPDIQKCCQRCISRSLCIYFAQNMTLSIRTGLPSTQENALQLRLWLHFLLGLFWLLRRFRRCVAGLPRWTWPLSTDTSVVYSALPGSLSGMFPITADAFHIPVWLFMASKTDFN